MSACWPCRLEGKRQKGARCCQLDGHNVVTPLRPCGRPNASLRLAQGWPSKARSVLGLLSDSQIKGRPCRHAASRRGPARRGRAEGRAEAGREGKGKDRPTLRSPRRASTSAHSGEQPRSSGLVSFHYGGGVGPGWPALGRSQSRWSPERGPARPGRTGAGRHPYMQHGAARRGATRDPPWPPAGTSSPTSSKSFAVDVGAES